jgi:polyisoprenyl-phosphate glycosyltransferase
MSTRRTLTIAVPLFNEDKVLPELIKRLRDVVSELAASGIAASVLMIDDGSSDQTPALIRQCHEDDARFGYVRLSRNFGHQAAIAAALDHIATDAVVVIDGDLQDPPELIPKMADIWRTGEAEVVYGKRTSRSGDLLKRFCYAGFYRLFNMMVHPKIPLDAGDFALMDRQVYERLRHFPERVRFLRGLRSWVGFRQIGIPYHRPERFAGSPKYSWTQLYYLATDGLASFSVAPLRIAQSLAFLWFFVSLGFLAWIVTTKAIGQIDTVLALLILLGFSISMLFFCIYILGAYISRMYLETKHRPIYITADHAPGVLVAGGSGKQTASDPKAEHLQS